MTGKEPAHYHSGGPDASKPRSSHIYVGDPLRSDMHQHDTASWEKMDSECCVYENTCTDAEVRYIIHNSTTIIATIFYYYNINFAL